MQLAAACKRWLPPPPSSSPSRSFELLFLCEEVKVEDDVVSPSLLARIDATKKTSSDFSLGMSEWTESEDSGKENQPHSDDDFKQKRRLIFRNSKQKKQDKIRFAESVSSSELATMTKAWFVRFSALGCCRTEPLVVFVCPGNSAHGWKKVSYNLNI